MSKIEGELIEASGRFENSPGRSRLKGRVGEVALARVSRILVTTDKQPIPEYDLSTLIDYPTQKVIDTLREASYSDEAEWLNDTMQLMISQGKSPQDLHNVASEHLYSTDENLYFELIKPKPTSIISD